MSGPASDPASDPAPKPALSPNLKFALEVGPLLLLIGVTVKYGLVAAAIPFAVASVIATAVLYRVQGKVNVVLVLSTLAVVVFAGLTWWSKDPTFLKLKVTIVSALLGVALLVGTALGKQPLRALFDGALPLDAEGWRKLSLRFGWFFLAMAGLNEVVRRLVDDEGYAIAKLALFFPLPILFMLTQLPLFKRHAPTAGGDASAP